MMPEKDESLIQEKIKKLLADPPPCKLSDNKRTDMIARLYKIREARQSVFYSFLSSRTQNIAATALALAVLLFTFNFLFSPMYPSLGEVSGTVKIYRASSNEWIFPQGSNIKIRANDIVKTFGDGQADIVLAQVYHIRLKHDTELKLASSFSRVSKGNTTYELAKGKVYTHYNKDRSLGKELNIVTIEARASALGTEFMVQTTPLLGTTWVGVLDGLVKVRSIDIPVTKEAEATVYVKPGEKTIIRKGDTPARPTRLMESELLEMEELYRIGTKPQVALLISTGPNRTRELLSVTPLYISGEKKGVLPDKLLSIARQFNRAIKEGSKEKGIENIKQLEDLVNNYPNPKYNAQFLLFIAAYYEYLDEHAKAIETFQKVIDRCPGSSLSSIAQYAIGIIYEEKLKDLKSAKEAYENVLSRYPNSPEAEEASRSIRNLQK